MSLSMRSWIVCVGVACTSAALAEPAAVTREKYNLAVELIDKGQAENALVVIDEALASAPKDVRWLGLKATVLLKLRDYPRALATYQAYLDAGAMGESRRKAQEIIRQLSAARSTFLVLNVENGPAEIYLDSKAAGVFCIAAPACEAPILPGTYKVIAERAGFAWSGNVTVHGETVTAGFALVEKRSQPKEPDFRVGAKVRASPASPSALARIHADVRTMLASKLAALPRVRLQDPLTHCSEELGVETDKVKELLNDSRDRVIAALPAGEGLLSSYVSTHWGSVTPPRISCQDRPAITESGLASIQRTVLALLDSVVVAESGEGRDIYIESEPSNAQFVFKPKIPRYARAGTSDSMMESVSIGEYEVRVRLAGYKDATYQLDLVQTRGVSSLKCALGKSDQQNSMSTCRTR